MCRSVAAVVIAMLLGCIAGAVLAAAPQPLRPDIESFIDEMVVKHAFNRTSLRKLFRQVEPRPAVIRAISAPGTARPWYEFRANYIEERRIAAGVRFWRQHTEALARAHREYGIPEELIVAT
ncbi:MAG TPA: lytic murein transglycosylase, partial [Burkholderiales bacterium]|nr:lytic murein transglycosylase [Burkholderiales bacterium]